MMNICSTCQGAQSECQERLHASDEYREHINSQPARRGAVLREGRRVVEQELPLAAGRGDRPRRRAREGRSAARGPAHRALLRLLHRPPDQAARHLDRPPARPLPRRPDRRARRRAGRVRGRPQVLRLPDHHDEPDHLAAPGRPPPGRRDRRGRGLPRDALPALPPEPRPPAARRREATSSATSTSRCSTCRRWSASRSASSPRSSGMNKHVVGTRDIQKKVAALAAA